MSWKVDAEGHYILPSIETLALSTGPMACVAVPACAQPPAKKPHKAMAKAHDIIWDGKQLWTIPKGAKLVTYAPLQACPTCPALQPLGVIVGLLLAYFMNWAVKLVHHRRTR